MKKNSNNSTCNLNRLLRLTLTVARSSKCLLFFLMMGFSMMLQAQNNNAPTWSGKGVSIPEGYQPREIKDIFARNAVTFEDMREQARYFPYIPGELVVAVELSMNKSAARQYLKNASWNKIFGSMEVEQKSVVLVHELKNGTTVALVHFNLPLIADVMETVKRLENTPGVLWSAPNFYIEGDPRDYTPNDPRYAEQYHHVTMKNNQAWDITKGSPNVVVAVTDDGVAITHPDLAENIWVNTGEIPGDGIDNDNNGFIDDVNGWDFSFNNNNPNPNTTGDSHGTHVGGIIAARMDNNIGVSGVAGFSKVMPIQFYGSGGAPWTATMVSASFAYAVDNGAQIINTSYNVDGFATNPVFLAGAQYVLDQGVLYFNSAGNNNQLNPPRQVVTQALFVASTTSTDQRSSFSNYGVGIDVSAPGSGILSTVTGDSYQFYNGTSMSTPNAAGAAALIWSANPGWNHYQVAAQLLGMADDIYPVNPTMIDYLGSGRVNSFASVSQVLPAPKVKSLTGIPAHGASTSGDITAFQLAFNQVMDPVSINNMNHFELRGAGANNTLGDGDDVFYSLTASGTYRIGTNALNYTIAGGPLPCGLYRLTIFAGGVKNPFDTPLDGDANGSGGDNFVREFNVSPTVYVDADNDGYGTGAPVTGVVGCVAPAGYSFVAGDCDDNNAAINPGATEICNGIDDNCDGYIDAAIGGGPSGFTFSNPAPMIISASGSNVPASLYPSPITVSGITAPVTKVKVTLNKLSHTWVNDVDILLVSPLGDKMVILSDAGTSQPSPVDAVIVLDDDATNVLTTSIVVTSGTYKPFNSGTTDPFPAPAPAAPYQNPAPAGSATLNGVFGGKDPNGVWNLYVMDDTNLDGGSISEGWEITFVTLDSVCSALSQPVVSVTQPSCSTPSGTIEVTSPLGAGYTYSIGGAYQMSPVFSGLTPGSYTVTAQDDDSNISPAIDVTINPVSGIPDMPGEVQGIANVCSYAGAGIPLTYSVAAVPGATSYNWTLPPTVTLLSGQGTSSITVTISTGFLSTSNRLIRVTASNDCGTSAARNYWLKSQLPGMPAAIQASSTDVCESIGTAIPILFSIPKVPGATSYIWTAQAGTTTITHINAPGENDTAVLILFSNTFTNSAVTVQSLNSCGVSAVRSLNLSTVLPSQPGLISGPTNICQHVGPDAIPAVYSVQPQSGVSNYQWDLPVGAFGVTGQGTRTISFLYPANYMGGSISVTAQNGCGSSAPRILRLNRLNPGAPGAIDVTQTAFCPNRVFTYAIPSIPSNATGIEWTVPAGATILSGQGTTSISVSYPDAGIAGSVTATATSNCGSSSTRVLKIKLAQCSPDVPPPPAPFVSNGTLDVLLFPNPTSGSVRMQLKGNDKQIVMIRVLDIHGRQLKQLQMMPDALKNFGDDLKPGMYMVEVLQGDKRIVKKLMKL
ncbi:MAG: S8 family serine peptidase [Ferruginibacter sp.]|nr:S8 family serine peptidase [Ferruginibacter sp.]